jgi:hypothetical protein
VSPIGAPTLYYGDEIGMEDVPIPPEWVQDPWEKNRSPFTVRRSPFTVRRSPFAVHRSPFTVRRSPFAVHRSPFAVRRSPFTVRRSPFNRSPFAVRRAPSVKFKSVRRSPPPSKMTLNLNPFRTLRSLSLCGESLLRVRGSGFRGRGERRHLVGLL